MFTEDTIAAIIGVIIITLPIFIGLVIIFKAIKKEITKEMQNGKTFWKAFKSFKSGNGYTNNAVFYSQPHNSIDRSTSGVELMNSPIYKNMPNNIYYYTSSNSTNISKIS